MPSCNPWSLQARRFHPDKAPHNNMSRAEAEILFRTIAEAHEVESHNLPTLSSHFYCLFIYKSVQVLHNPSLRDKYDAGQDVKKAAQQKQRYSYDKRDVKSDGSVKGWGHFADGQKVRMHFKVGTDGKTVMQDSKTSDKGVCAPEAGFCVTWTAFESVPPPEEQSLVLLNSSVVKTSSPLNSGKLIKVDL